MIRTRLAVPFLLLSACASPRAITELGPEPALAPLSAQLQTQDGDSVQLDVDIARAAYVTVLAVERNRAVSALGSSGDMVSVWLEPGAHRLALQPASRRAAAPAPRPDPGPEILASMGLSRGTPQPPERIEGVGYVPQEQCPDAAPDELRYCAVLPTEPLVPPQRVPPTRYLLVIATDHPFSLGELQARLKGLDLSADGRELLTDVAVSVTGSDARWAAYGVRR